MTNFLEFLTFIWCIFGGMYVVGSTILLSIVYMHKGRLYLPVVLLCLPGCLITVGSLIAVCVYNYNKYIGS
jgi:hypothetical protein